MFLLEKQPDLMRILLSLLLLFATPAFATRAKDVGSFYGVRDNQIQGAGLVVGLQRSGDSARNVAAFLYDAMATSPMRACD